MNEVNEENFNETCKGYLIRALRIANESKAIFNKDLVEKLLNGLNWSFDELTMTGARKEYEKYVAGTIEFDK